MFDKQSPGENEINLLSSLSIGLYLCQYGLKIDAQ